MTGDPILTPGNRPTLRFYKSIQAWRVEGSADQTDWQLRQETEGALVLEAGGSGGRALIFSNVKRLGRDLILAKFQGETVTPQTVDGV